MHLRNRLRWRTLRPCLRIKWLKLGSRILDLRNATAMEMTINTTVTLNNLVQMPLLGMGMFKVQDGILAKQVVLAALEAGYRMIDTATIYGNEASVGAGLKESGHAREDIFITTKLWNDDQGYKETRKALENSLRKLGTTYVDLYLVHWPVVGKRLESWKAMEDMYEQGMCRAIGVSNYMRQHLLELLMSCRIKPAVNQIELSPYNYQAREEIVQFCRKNDIHIETYSPLTKGLKLTDPRLLKLSARYFKSPAQILIRWALQHGYSVIPKSERKERIYENASVFDFVISEEDMGVLGALNESLTTSWDPTEMP